MENQASRIPGKPNGGAASLGEGGAAWREVERAAAMLRSDVDQASAPALDLARLTPVTFVAALVDMLEPSTHKVVVSLERLRCASAWWPIVTYWGPTDDVFTVELVDR